MKETLISFIFNNMYIIAWTAIFAFVIFDKSSKRPYKYEQRIQPKKLSPQKLEKKIQVLKEEQKELHVKLKKHKIILLVLLIFTIIGTITFSITLLIGVTNMSNFFCNPLTYLILYWFLIIPDILVKNIAKTYKYITLGVGLTLSICLYCILYHNMPFFWDLLVILVTIILYFIFFKTRYKYIILLITLGINLIIYGQRFTGEQEVLCDLLFALGTGVIATGICNVFSIMEKKKEHKNERVHELNQVLYGLEDVTASLFFCFKQKTRCNVSFKYINFKKFCENLSAF